MQIESFALAVIAAALTATACWLSWGRRIPLLEAEAQKRLQDVREAEKSLHLRETEALEKRNLAQLAHQDALREARAAAFEEGRQLGLAESHRDHVVELSKQREEFATQLIEEKSIAEESARSRLRAEYELQTKLFAVKIAPYVKIVEDKSIFNKKHEFVSGYQYQLLINGIPAFQPHIVAERTEIKSEINPALEQAVLEVAKVAANAAIDQYLGTNSQFARLAPQVVERIPK